MGYLLRASEDEERYDLKTFCHAVGSSESLCSDIRLLGKAG